MGPSHALGIGVLALAAGLPQSAELELLDGARVPITRAEAEVERLIRAAAVPGLSVAVINEGRIAYASGFGVREAGAPAPVDEDTVFGGLSFSKTVFAYLVMKLVDRGDLDLDRPLYSYLDRPLPEYDFYADLAGDDAHRQITARMALSHTTGWPNWRWFTDEDKLTFWFAPGQRFSYSGEGFAYLQLVVEHVTGRSITELAHALVFEPLAMTRTSFLWEERFEDNFAASHDHYGRSIGKERWDEGHAAGSIQTTASDYARFLLAVARGDGLEPESARRLLSPQVSIRHRAMFGPALREETAAHEASRLSWGLGFGLVHTPHGWAHFHTGNDRGCSNYMVAYPDRGIAVVLLGNSNRLESVAHELTRTLTGDVSSPFGFLGYEPFDSPVNQWISVMLEDGLAAAQQYHASLQPAARREAGLDEEAAYARAGADLTGFERFDLASEFFDLYLERFPGSVAGLDGAADARMGRGEAAAAQALLERALKLVREDAALESRIRWRIGWARALASPYDIPIEDLQRFAGQYGPRRVVLRDGFLFYVREDGDDPTEKRLIPMSQDTFVLRDLDWFRLRFDLDGAGTSGRVVGLYLGGRADESPRSH